MKIKEEISKEIKEYIEKFEELDNDLSEGINQKEIEYEEKKQEFNEKWDEDIFPADIPVRDKEAAELEEEANKIKNERRDIEKKIQKTEDDFRKVVSEIEKKIEDRRNEIVEYVNNKEQLLESKRKLQKQLEEQIKGVELWEENGINKNDTLYQRRKNIIIPDLENQIKELDSKLDEKSLREEYKELGKIKNQIKDIKLHDRKHIISELTEIFEVKENNQDQITGEPTEKEPVVTEPIEQEQATTKPIEQKQIITEKKQTKPDGTNAIEQKTYQESAEKTEDKKMTIGRKIKLIDSNGKVYSVAKSKEYFEKYDSEKLGLFGKIVAKMKKSIKNRIYGENLEENEKIEKSDIYSDLEEEMDDIIKMPELSKLDPIIAYGLKEGLANKILTSKEVLQTINAIESNDKETLNKILPIKWDKNDLSKGAFLPWNRKSRDQIVKQAEENKELMEVTGEYEPSLLKRLKNKAEKYFPAKEEQKYITDGSEKNVSSHQKLRDFQERAGIKMSQEQLQENEQETEEQTQIIGEQEKDNEEVK